MDREREIARCAAVYAWLVRLHPAPFRDRFGPQMEQLFRDRLRDVAREGRSVLRQGASMCAETTLHLLAQHLTLAMRRHRTLLRLALATSVLLLVPATAMLVSDAVDWTLLDFILAATAIFGTGLAHVVVTRQRGGALYRCAAGLALMSTLLLVWLNGAVGLIGSERNDFNALYGLVLAVGVVGAALARLRPGGMARTMAAMASAHGAIGALALASGRHGASSSEAFEILGVTGMFMVLFLVAAFLFRQAGRGRPASAP